MKPIELSKDKRDAMIKKIQVFFMEERSEDLGDLAALLVLDFIVDQLGREFYNQGIDDAISYMTDKVDDLYGLKK